MKEKNKKVIILIVMVLLLVGIVIGVTYAAFTFSKIGTTENVVKTGAVTMTYTEGDNGITINNAMPMSDEVGKKLNEENQIFDFTININIIGKMGISYEVTAEKDRTSTLANNEVRLYLEKSLDRSNYDEVLEPSYYTPIDAKDDFGAKAGEMILDNGTTSETVTYYYRLRMWVDENYELSEVAKKFTVRVNAYGKDGIYTEPVKKQNIKMAYVYNQESGASNHCITGEETTCEETTCYENESVGSCPAGTIIKYAVNDNEEKYFHVIHDDGKTMTLQQRESTIYSIAWCNREDYIAAGGLESDYNASSSGGSVGNHTKGPLTALKALEEATANWTNVNNQTYTMGTTIFKDNAYTGCTNDLSCLTSPYTLPERTAKSRMITIQEAVEVGCEYNSWNNGNADGYASCPIWMYNYLLRSTDNGGTVDADYNVVGRYHFSYYTMTTITSYGKRDSGIIRSYGDISSTSTASNLGVRAVIVINK